MPAVKVLAEVILQAEDKTILIVRRGTDDTKRPGQWDVPGGHVDDGEDLVAAAIRETVEETGITVQDSALQLAYTLSKPWDTSLSCSWLFFTAQTTKQTPVLSHEHTEFAWVSLDDAIGMIEYDLQKQALQYIRDNHLLN